VTEHQTIPAASVAVSVVRPAGKSVIVKTFTLAFLPVSILPDVTFTAGFGGETDTVNVLPLRVSTGPQRPISKLLRVAGMVSPLTFTPCF
jgi:hypothetical protein